MGDTDLVELKFTIPRKSRTTVRPKTLKTPRILNSIASTSSSSKMLFTCYSISSGWPLSFSTVGRVGKLWWRPSVGRFEKGAFFKILCLNNIIWHAFFVISEFYSQTIALTKHHLSLRQPSADGREENTLLMVAEGVPCLSEHLLQFQGTERGKNDVGLLWFFFIFICEL